MQTIFSSEKSYLDIRGFGDAAHHKFHQEKSDYCKFNKSVLVALPDSFGERINIATCSGTGSFLTKNQVNSRLNIERSIREEKKVIPTKIQIDAIRGKMGLNMSEIATIMNVSRQAIYDWVDDNAKLKRSHQERLDIFFSICLFWSEKNIGRLGSYLYKKINNENESLFELFQHKVIDKNYIIKALEKIEQAKISYEENIEPHKSNLIKYGFEDLSEEQMDKNLRKITREIG